MAQTDLTIDLLNHDRNDIFVVLPVETFGLDGEPGQPFTLEFRQFLWYWASLGYWPVDFGEANNTHVTLWLKFEPGVADAQTKHFIDKGGDV